MWAGKDPWRKQMPTADSKKHDAVVVGQVMARDARKTRKTRTRDARKKQNTRTHVSPH
jgi:hypothetical protein